MVYYLYNVLSDELLNITCDMESLIDCPNILYVACTRATHHLYLIESNNRSIDRPLDFLHSNVQKLVDYLPNYYPIYC